MAKYHKASSTVDQVTFLLLGSYLDQNIFSMDRFLWVHHPRKQSIWQQMFEATRHTKSGQEGEERECVCAQLPFQFLYKPGSQTRESYHPHWPDLLILINSIKMISHKHDQRAICQVILTFAKMTIDNDFSQDQGRGTSQSENEQWSKGLLHHPIYFRRLHATSQHFQTRQLSQVYLFRSLTGPF